MHVQYSIHGLSAMPEQLLLSGLAPGDRVAAPLPVAAPPGPQTLFLALFPSVDEQARIADRIHTLCRNSHLESRRIAAERLHVTLHLLAVLADAVPQPMIDVAVAAVSTVRHRPIGIRLARAGSFVHCGPGAKAFVLRSDNPRDNAPVLQFVDLLEQALRRRGLQSRPSRQPHMTMLYDRRIVPERRLDPICWTASEFVLVLSHVGRTRHEWIARWPLDRDAGEELRSAERTARR